MKFFNISCLLISLSLNLISGYLMKRDDPFEIEYDLNYISEECSAELESAVKCIRKISSEFDTKLKGLENLNVEQFCNPTDEKLMDSAKCKEAIKTGLNIGCEIFSYDECKDFAADGTVTKIISSSKCGENEREVVILEKLAGLKGSYLMACGKNEKGDLCPLANYVTNNAVDFIVENSKTINKLIKWRYMRDSENDFEATLDITNDILTVLPILNGLNSIVIDSCFDSACNKNIIALDNMAMASKSLYEKKQQTDLTKTYPNVFNLYEEYVENFKNNKCENVGFDSDNSGSRSTMKKISYTFITINNVSILLLL